MKINDNVDIHAEGMICRIFASVSVCCTRYVGTGPGKGSSRMRIEPFGTLKAPTYRVMLCKRAMRMADSQTTPKENGRDAAERSLLEAVAAGDRDALAELYKSYHPRLFKFVYRLTKSHPATEEVVNDIMLAVWKSASGYRGDAKPSTWIFGIAYRQSLKRISKRRLSIAANVRPEDLLDDRPAALEQEDWVRSGLAALPASQRIAVELVFFLGLSYEEVAAVTDCPVNTVKTRMFHARRKLRECLETQSGTMNQEGGAS